MLIQSVVTIGLMIIRQEMKVSWSNNRVAKELYLEKTEQKHDEYKNIEAVDVDGTKYMDEKCIKHNELFEVGLEKDEDLMPKLNRLVDNTIPKHVFVRWPLIKRILVQCVFPWPFFEGVIMMP